MVLSFSAVIVGFFFFGGWGGGFFGVFWDYVDR